MRAMGVTPLPVRAPPHGGGVAALLPLHGDPFDRLLVARARVPACALVTADRRLQVYEVETLFVA
jgi:PIN domain nuclease of toxin-antitoxin system